LTTKISGVEKMTQEMVSLNETRVKDQTRVKLSGHTVQWTQMHPDRDLDIALRTFRPGAEFEDLQRAHDTFYFTRKIWEGDPANRTARINAERAREEFVSIAGGAGFKALDTAESGGGTEWVPTASSAELTGRFMLELGVARLFDTFDMPSGSGAWDWPVKTASATPYLVSQQTADYTETTVPTVTPSQLTTAKRTFTAVVIGARQDISRELDYDSIVAILPTVNADNVIALAEGVEDAIINGDTTATHQDADVTAGMTADVRRAWPGLRVMAQSGAKTDAGTVAFDDTLMFTMLKNMGKWSMRPSQCAIIPGVSAYWQMVAFGNLRTIQNYGPGTATLVAGELARFCNIPIVPSEKMRLTLATGLRSVTEASNTKTGVLAVNHRSAKIGLKRGVELESWYVPPNQMTLLIATTRLAYQFMYSPSATGNTIIGWIYDITS